jgi:indolepyruvate ferredoxin oxidoreductase beta subunit
MNIIICGVGGQGTILASKILAQAALNAGAAMVRTGETIGMSQRGGSVVSHVRIGTYASSYIPMGGADLLLGFEWCEAARCAVFLKNPGGIALVSDTEIIPVSASLGISEYDTDKIKQGLAGRYKQINESGKTANIALIAAAYTNGLLDMPEEAIIDAMKQCIKPKFIEQNLEVFRRVSSSRG